MKTKVGDGHVNKFGRVAAAANGEVVQDEGGVIAIRTVASKVEAISGDAGDVLGGAGAEYVKIHGVDENWNPISEVLTMAGLSASASSTQSFLYVFRGYIYNSGETSNLGAITIRVASAGATMAKITLGFGQTEKCMMPVLAGCKFDVRTLRFEGGQARALDGELGLFSYELGQGINLIHALPFGESAGRTINFEKYSKVINEKSLLWIGVIDISDPIVVAASIDGYMRRYTGLGE